MKAILTCLLGLLSFITYCQVGIGTTSPAAQLHIENNSDPMQNGVILPKMTTAQVASMTTNISSLTTAEKDLMSGFMFYVENVDGESELWHYNRSTDKLEPVHRKLKSFSNVALSGVTTDGNTEQFLELDNELIDVNDNFGLLASETDIITGIITEYYGFTASRAGYYQVYAQYHTSQGAGAGNYGLNVYKTDASETYNAVGTRDLIASSSHSSTAADALNVVHRSLSTIVRLEVGDIIDFSWDSDIVITGGLQVDSTKTYVYVKAMNIDY